MMNTDVCLNKEMKGDVVAVVEQFTICGYDAVLIADSYECQQRMVNQMGVVCGRRKLKVNEKNSKVMKMSKLGEYWVLNGKKMEE